MVMWGRFIQTVMWGRLFIQMVMWGRLFVQMVMWGQVVYTDGDVGQVYTDGDVGQVVYTDVTWGRFIQIVSRNNCWEYQ